MSIQKYIKDNIYKLGKTAYISPDIPDKKVNAAIQSFGKEINPEYIIAIYDSTIFSSGKEGCLFIGDACYLKAPFEKPLKILYEDIQNIEYSTSETTTNRGKIKIEENVHLQLKNEDSIKLTPHLINVNSVAFVELIQEVLEEATDNGN